MLSLPALHTTCSKGRFDSALFRVCVAVVFSLYALFIPIHLATTPHIIGVETSASSDSHSSDHHHEHQNAGDHHTPHYSADHILSAPVQKSISVTAVDFVLIETYPLNLLVEETPTFFISLEHPKPVGGSPPGPAQSRAPPLV